MTGDARYARKRNQMQTRADAEIVVYSVGDRKPGDQKYAVQNDSQENSQGCPESKNQKSSKPKTNRGKAEIVVVKQRGVVYYLSINWLTLNLNRHRIKLYLHTNLTKVQMITGLVVEG